jgi:hypothetical protein
MSEHPLSVLRQAVLEAYAYSPTSVLTEVSRALLDSAGVRSLIVALHPGNPYPQLEATVRLDDISEPLIAQVVQMVCQMLKMPPQYVASAGAGAARAAMMWINLYRMRQRVDAGPKGGIG